MMRTSIAMLWLLLLGNIVAVAFGDEHIGKTGPDLFSGEFALQHVADQVAFGPRPTGSPEIFMAGDLILERLTAWGWDVSEDWHTIDFGPVVIPVRNLVASFGEGPTIILGAHYDTRLFANRDPDESLRFERVLGANDAGSGVGVLLELARVLSQHYVPENEIRLVFFDAEDNGNIDPWSQWSQARGVGAGGGYIIGSSLYANSLDLEVENIQFMILVDMVGDMDQHFPIESNSNRSAPEIVNAIWSIAADLGYEEQFDRQPRGAITDDHVPFILREIPAVDIIDLDYQFWHTTEDTLDKISPQSLERVGRTLQAFLEQSGAITRID